jgi:RimJ/RimL family protein N-acetyltransferase
MKSPEHFLSSFYYPRIRDDRNSCLFAILTKTPTINSQGASQPAGSLAGIIGLLNAQPHNAACELGYLLILRPFQRTFVTTHACGLLLQYLLRPTSQGGLGLRRAAWKAHWQNAPSIAAAKRLGFQLEGTIRWERSCTTGKPALNVSSGRGEVEWEGVVGCVARHTVLLGLCWDDWEQGGEDHIMELMSR